jgi:site-specific DNA-methyltransferase (adenine-specific)
MKYEIIHADVLEALKKMPVASFDAVLTDPPYALGSKEPTAEEIIAYLTGARLDTGGDFMSKKWDLPSVEVWKETLRVLRPGAHVLAFGGTRMFDMLTVGMRAGGFKVRDCLSWMYSSGFPKSLDVSKAIDTAADTDRPVIGSRAMRGRAAQGFSAQEDGGMQRYGPSSGPDKEVPVTAPATPDAARFDGWGTALKPAWEPIVLARKPLDDTIAANALLHGTGGLNIDGTRIGYASDADREELAAGVEAIRERGGVMNNSWKNSSDLSGANPASALGRWPANAVLSHTPECRRIGTKRVEATSIHGTTTAVRQTGVHSEAGGHQTIGREQPVTGYADADGLEEIEAWECSPDCPARLLDEQSGDRPGMSGGGQHRPEYGGGMFGAIDSPDTARNDNGGASRFFATFPADEPEYSVLRGGDPDSIETFASREQAEERAAELGNGSYVVTSQATSPLDGAARFAYIAKASRAEREFGCEHLPAQTALEAVERDPDSPGAKNPRAGAGRGAGAVRERCAKCNIVMGGSNHTYLTVPCTDGGEHEPIAVGRGEPVRNHHVSVKPIALTRWLATLLLPPPLGRPRRILVLYAGSGSEMIGAMRAGWDEVVGIEREPVKEDSPNYVAIARARLERWSQVPAKMSEKEAVGEARVERKKVGKGQTSLF